MCRYPHTVEAKAVMFRSQVAAEASIDGDLNLLICLLNVVQSLKFLLMVQK